MRSAVLGAADVAADAHPPTALPDAPRYSPAHTTSVSARWAVSGVGDLWRGEERSGTRGSPAPVGDGPARSHEAAARSAPLASGIAAALVPRAPQRSRRAAPTATVGAHPGYRPPRREGVIELPTVHTAAASTPPAPSETPAPK